MANEHKLPHHNHDHHNHAGSTPPRTRPLHHKWQFWVAIVLMLAAMFAYVATMDESIQPNGQVGAPVPAAP